MPKDQLFLLQPGFFKESEGPFYCGDSVAVEGLLSFFPQLRNEVDVHYIGAPRPRAAIVALIGADNQSAPVLVLGDERVAVRCRRGDPHAQRAQASSTRQTRSGTTCRRNTAWRTPAEGKGRPAAGLGDKLLAPMPASLFVPSVMPCAWACALGAWAAGLALAAAPALALPTFDEVRADFRSSETLVLSREGEVIQRLRTDATVRRGQWLGLADVSPALRQALILSEDRRFYEHSGVDWTAVSAAVWANLWHERTRGASHPHHAAGRPAGWRLAPGRGRAHGHAEDGPGRGRAAAGARLAQGPDPGGLPEPGAVSRRDGGHRCPVTHPVRQGRPWAGCARGGRGRGPGARAQCQGGAGGAARLRRAAGHAAGQGRLRCAGPVHRRRPAAPRL